jgi:hypothetical protein
VRPVVVFWGEREGEGAEVGQRVGRVSGQIRSASGRSSKIVRDRQRIEAVVDFAGLGGLIFSVDSEGRYTLHSTSEGEEAPTSALLAAGELRGGAEHEPG